MEPSSSSYLNSIREIESLFGFKMSGKLTPEQETKVRAFLWDKEKRRKRDAAREHHDPKPITEFVNPNGAFSPEVSPIEVDLFVALQSKSITTGRPRQSHPVGPYFIDIAFPDVRLAVECDGRAYHSTPAQMARDQRRTDYLSKLGWTVIRFSGSEIHRNLYDCVDRISGIYEGMCSDRGLSEPWEQRHYRHTGDEGEEEIA